MGRELRKVPENWVHPKENGRLVPLYGRSYEEEAKEWDIGESKWKEGLIEDFNGGWKLNDTNFSYEEWVGSRPLEEDYMPDWPEEERTHLMMYEDTSEGTPISPAFETPEALATWLADSGASSNGSSTATYEQWLSTIKRGSAPSMVLSSKGLQSGVEALSEINHD